ncbi:MAG: hypothetical protein D6768_15470 [Chloroflexi bacterium]|nr:MAG: hypothetical protein D6768_15470 [Chloroflexota bacterium]
MKRSSTLLTNTSLIFIVVIVAIGLFGLSTVFAATGTELLVEHVDVAATAEAIQIINREAALDETSQQRLRDIESEIRQVNSAINKLRQTQKTELARQQSQLQAINQQIAQKQTEVDNLQATLSTLQQTVQDEEELHNIQINTLATQLGEEENTLRRKLQSTQIELDDIQTESLKMQETTTAGHATDDLSAFDHPGDNAGPAEFFGSNSDHDSADSSEGDNQHSGSDSSDNDSHSSGDNSHNDKDSGQHSSNDDGDNSDHSDDDDD